MHLWRLLDPRRESFEEMERRLEAEVRRKPPDRPELKYAPLPERRRDDGASDSGGTPDDCGDGGCDGGD